MDSETCFINAIVLLVFVRNGSEMRSMRKRIIFVCSLQFQ